jgi:DNA-binding response OmpR family regulator
MSDLISSVTTSAPQDSVYSIDLVMSNKILVVEDNLSLLQTLKYNLRAQGYEVVTAKDGPQALQRAREDRPDLILLDVMLSGIDGFEVCQILRQEMNAPILILSARSEEVDKVVGLEVGADDYITKPFSMRELLARIKAQLRRMQFFVDEQREQNLSELGSLPEIENLAIDIKKRTVTSFEQTFHLKPMELDLLLYFVRNCGLALSRERILQQVWGWEYMASSRTVDVHVRWLREKIEEKPEKPLRIVTVRGVGYRFDG